VTALPLPAPSGLSLPALDGRTPLGFLAALGVLRLVAEHTEHRPRLAWSRQDFTAVLHDAQQDVDTLVADLIAVVRTIPDDGVLPGLRADFPPPGEAPDKLRLTRPAFADYARQVAAHDGIPGERWLGSLVTDLSVDDKHRADISLFAAPSGKQSMRTMLDKPLTLIRKRPELLGEALVAWRRYPGVSGEYLDHRVLFDAVDAADGKSAERGVPGATCWRDVVPAAADDGVGAHPATYVLAGLGRRVGRRLVYLLWSSPLDVPPSSRAGTSCSTAPNPAPLRARAVAVDLLGRSHAERDASPDGPPGFTRPPARPSHAQRPERPGGCRDDLVPPGPSGTARDRPRPDGQRVRLLPAAVLPRMGPGQVRHQRRRGGRPVRPPGRRRTRR
jgi:hypothetical protein